MTRRVTVAGDRPYDVVIGRDLTDEIVAAVPDRATKVAILHAPFFADDVRVLADT